MRLLRLAERPLDLKLTVPSTACVASSLRRVEPPGVVIGQPQITGVDSINSRQQDPITGGVHVGRASSGM